MDHFKAVTYLLVRKQVMRSEIHQINNWSHQEFKRFGVPRNRLQPLLELCLECWWVSIRENGGNFLASALGHYWCGWSFHLLTLLVPLFFTIFSSNTREKTLILHLHFLSKLCLSFLLIGLLCLSYLKLSSELCRFNVMRSPTLNEVFCRWKLNA